MRRDRPLSGPLRVALLYRCSGADAGDPFYRIVPDGLLCIHGCLRQAGHDSRLFNFSACTPENIQSRLARFQPHLTGISIFTYNHTAAVQLIRQARQACPGTWLVAGGVQATYLDQRLLDQVRELDGVIRGEGEAAMLTLAEQLMHVKPDLTKVPGFTFRNGTEMPRTPPAPPASRLDDCYPAKRFEALEGIDPAEQFPVVITSRGCPAKCRFCCSPSFWPRGLRFRSPEAVLSDLRILRQRHRLNFFSIRDDTFTANRLRLQSFTTALQREKPGVDWNCQSRVNLVDEESLYWMKAAGCGQVQYGVESASPRMLRALGKNITPSMIRNALRASRHTGMQSFAYFITGIPGQTRDDLHENRRLFEEEYLMDGITAPLCYYPGTAIFETARRKGLVTESIFESGNPPDLLVRQDPEARDLFVEMEQIIDHWRARNQNR